MTVIATDGFSIEPIVVERIISLSGERYDVVLNARNDSNLSKTAYVVATAIFRHFSFNAHTPIQLLFQMNP